MRTSTLNKKELEIALDRIFDFMEKKGIKVDESKKTEFKERIANDLENQLTPDDIKNVDVQKKLLSCVASLIMGKENEYKEMITTLKSNEKDEKLEKNFEHRLTAQLVFLAILSKLGDPEQKKKIELTPDAFKQKILESEDEKVNKTFGDIPKPDTNTLGKQIDDTLRNLYGGHDPKFNGGIDFPILGPIFGNLLAYTNQSIPDPNALSLMVDAITLNTQKTDPLGLENSTKILEMEDGIDMGSVLTPRNTFGG